MPTNRKNHELLQRCDGVIELLSAYLSEELSDRETAEIRQHLSGCPGCDKFFESLKTTVAWTGKLKEEDIPFEVLDRLQSFLKRRIRR